MAKLGRNTYRTAKGETRLNCYMVPIKKELIAKTDITENDELKISVIHGKIVIEKEK